MFRFWENPTEKARTYICIEVTNESVITGNKVMKIMKLFAEI